MPYLLLPKEITSFEKRYTAKMNKVALIFFYLHIPFIMAVAYVAGTGVWLALALSLLVVAGPTAAYFLFSNLRSVSIVCGITAMLLGGLLVHFGQGPLQVEMHFYFFALLAMLCMFANPAVNLAAAGTAAVHHLAVFVFLPTSFVNYDAAWWVVAVHSAFVVMETLAACYISRQFFDNVIGLEKIIDARTSTIREQQSQMKLILDNVAEGLITVDLEGNISGSGSKVLTDWFGEPTANQSVAEWLTEKDAKFAEWFELSLESVTDGFLPQEVAISQMPSSISVGDRNYTVSYQLIDTRAETPPEHEQREFERPENLEEPKKMLLVITDVTEALIKAATQARQAELLELFQHINRDRSGFLEFLSEAEQLMVEFSEGKYDDLDHLKRLVHTLKGNAAIFGMGTLSGLCHTIETKIDDEGEAPSEFEVAQVSKAWSNVRSDLAQVLGETTDEGITLEDDDYQSILRAIADGTDYSKVKKMIESWQLEPTSRRLSTIGKQLEGLAERLGKDNVSVKLESNNLRFDSDHFAPFWSSFIHVLRNTVDHGVEDSESRAASGKSAESTIVVSTSRDIDSNEFVVSIRDDGPGVNWTRLKEKASEQGIDVGSLNSQSDLLFMSGLSSKSEVSDVSGRGVGMSAVAETCKELGGNVQVTSEPGNGTCFNFRFPMNENVYEGHTALLQGIKAA